MTEPKFTPGPWQVPENASGFEIESACGIQVAQASQTCPVRQASDHDERRANAKLIASAPELYGALRACCLILTGETMHKQGLIGALEKARAALKKARGEV